LSLTNVQAQIKVSPTLKIITPSEGQTIYGNKVPILLSVENFNLVDYQKNPSPAPSQGHIHLWLDDANPTKESAVNVIEDSFIYNDVPYADHSLRAELVTNDNNPLSPPVFVLVNFKNAPVSSPSPIPTSSFDKNTALVILVVVALVILAAWWYTKEEDEPVKSESKSKVIRKKTARRKAR